LQPQPGRLFTDLSLRTLLMVVTLVAANPSGATNTRAW